MRTTVVVRLSAIVLALGGMGTGTRVEAGLPKLAACWDRGVASGSGRTSCYPGDPAGANFPADSCTVLDGVGYLDASLPGGTVHCAVRPSTTCDALDDNDCASSSTLEGRSMLSKTTRKNILLIVADDHAYCHFGFMAGVCAKAGGGITYQSNGRTCWSDRDCDHTQGFSCLTNRQCADDTFCTSDADCTAEGGARGSCMPKNDKLLRLNDLTCRNRQPLRPDGDGQGTQCSDANEGDSSGKLDSGGSDKDHFKHDRTRFPCTGTKAYEDGEAWHGATPLTPPRTPHLDQLATTGALFPRAYVGGTSCKTSRRVTFLGKHQRHFQYLFPPPKGKAECAMRDDRGPIGCQAAGKTSCQDTKPCEPVHAIGWWFKNGGGGAPAFPLVMVTASPTTTTTTLALPATQELPSFVCTCTTAYACAGVASGAACSCDSADHCAGATPICYRGALGGTGTSALSPAPCDPTVTDPCGTGAGNGTCVPDAPYRRGGFAKLEVVDENSGSFDVARTAHGLGKYPCGGDDEDVCDDAFADTLADRVDSPTGDPDFPPRPVYFTGAGVGAVMNFIDEQQRRGDIVVGGATHQTSWRQNPFFIWYGPHIPHQTYGPDDHFYAPYGGEDGGKKHGEEAIHFARISLLDSLVGSLRHHLEHACVCDHLGHWESLLDSTVIVFLTDQGFLMPGSKNSGPNENTLRTQIIVNEPRHRLLTSNTDYVKPRVFDTEFGHAIDVLPTILNYASIPYGRPSLLIDPVMRAGEDVPSHYPWSVNLGAKMKADMTSEMIRGATYGEVGSTNTVSPSWDVPRDPPDEKTATEHFIIPRRGQLGVCQYSPASTDPDPFHVEPCLPDDDEDDFDCRAAEGTGTVECVETGRHCINKPSTLCDDDADCSEGLCAAGGECKKATRADEETPDNGAFHDFDDRPCGSCDSACVPNGYCSGSAEVNHLCQPPLMKFATDANANVARMWDLDATPDDNFADKTAITTIDEQLKVPIANCLKQFWTNDSSSSGAYRKSWSGVDSDPCVFGQP